MFRSFIVLLLAAPMVTASGRMDLESQFAQAKIAQNLLRSDVKHWQTEKNTLEELLDGRDTISSKASEKFQGQLNHAKNQLGLAEAALEVQNLELTKMEIAAKSEHEQAADLSDSPLWTPTAGQGLPAMEAQKETTLVEHTPGKHSAKLTGDCILVMKDQQSDKDRSPCIFNETYGCDGDRHMWVDQGCRATFDCNGGHEKCWSISYKFEKCRCDEHPKSFINPAQVASINAWNPTPAAGAQPSPEEMVKDWMKQSKKAEKKQKDQFLSKVANLLQKSQKLSQEEKILQAQHWFSNDDPDADPLANCKSDCGNGFASTGGETPAAFEGLEGHACEEKCVQILGYYRNDFGDKISLGHSVDEMLPRTQREQAHEAQFGGKGRRSEGGSAFDNE